MKYLISSDSCLEKDLIILKPDNWDDYSYKTLFEAVYIDRNGVRMELGSIKVAKSGLNEGYTKDYMPTSFVELPKDFFSLWQSAESYKKVKEIENKYNISVFKTLHDIAYDLDLLEKYETQRIVTDSLLRFVSKHMCVNQFNRIAHGEAVLTQYDFDYLVKQEDDFYENLCLKFSVHPKSLPPTNIHAIIGSNGTGKTTLIKKMILSICEGDESKGKFIYSSPVSDELGYFESVMCVSFSPFDDYSNLEKCKNFRYVGVRKKYGEESNTCSGDKLNLLDDIKLKFIESFKNCMSNKTKKEDWVDIMNMFNTQGDSLFGTYNFKDIAMNADILSYENTTMIEKIFDNMSAGHKEVLSIVTRCIDQFAERTIMFLDEPENHLHPPLLSSMIRGISKMLIKRTGVAIISTHSPIVLQEIPRSCVWILNREEDYLSAYRPQIETFGTNVGVLTNEVFNSS